MKLESLLWLLPVVFMIHDFEEIIMMKPWFARRGPQLERRFPWLAKRLLPHMTGLSSGAFALAVAEEFVLLSAFTWLAVENGWLNAWAGVTLAFGVHLVIHFAQAVAFRGYIPAAATCLPAGLFCVYALLTLNSAGLLNWPQVWLSTLVAGLILVPNLLLAHALAARFDKITQHG